MEDKSFVEKKILLGDNREAGEIFGSFDEKLRLIEKNFAVKIVARGNEIIISGENDQVQKVEEAISFLLTSARNGNRVSMQDLTISLGVLKDAGEEKLQELAADVIQVTPRGKQIKPKTFGQRKYVQAIKANDIVFCIGPAGTGKTYLAIAMAVTALKNREVNKIILTRPAVEAGEKLGFLPGDIQEKVNPYLRPLYDSLNDILGPETFQKNMEKNIIEVAPLAYMRGRTLDDAYIILDEAQNTTSEQMKMFLTRIGFGSKAIITGDVTQVDLPRDKKSGLNEVQKILSNIDGIQFVNLTEKDVVRHPLVQKIIKAYEKFGQAQQKKMFIKK